MKMPIKALTICLILTLSGCVYAPLPKLPEIKPVPCPPIQPVAKVSCPVLDIPDPVPQNVTLEIKAGKVVKIDSGGESLIRSYIATRKAQKASWSK